eukprot:CAMPEP_0194246660 /NCGR_PEP_ID=MMETSP0158-20130606/15374_1 /TAXON_ID=33649 /ORGANISM="Thalassionema nitzschioides, Strain L26-B" /LENGTH=396 /DNA_ID=CAMNT_0038982615 /DNA_START=37 /DNA_END=1224 /DNA_ORIENTATION=+
MTRRSVNLFVLFLSLLPIASKGWINPTHSNQIKTSVFVERVDAGDEILTSPCPSCSSSRRQWLSSVALTFTAAAIAPPALAATATAPIVTSKSTCDVSVSVWNQPSNGRRVYILGTAHISSQSATLAGDLVHDVNPNAVFVELDKKRVKNFDVVPLTDELKKTPTILENSPPTENGNVAGAKKMNAPFVQGPSNDLPSGNGIPSSKQSSSPSAGVAIGAAAVGTAIKSMYGKMSNQGFNPGEEFVVAMREGQAVGAKVILGDRDVDVTLQRLTQALQQTDLKKLLSADSDLENSMRELMPSGQEIPNDKDAAYKEELTAFIETMKAKETIKLVMGQLQKAAPEVYEAMVAERDAYMANGINQLNAFPVIVAVMGLAHVDGVERYLESEGWSRAPLV